MRTMNLCVESVLSAALVLLALPLYGCSAPAPNPSSPSTEAPQGGVTTTFNPVPGAPPPAGAAPTPYAAVTPIAPIGIQGQAGATFQVGDVISLDDLTLAVLGWSTAPEFKGTKADPGKKFVLVDVVLFNRGGKQSSNIFTARLQDASGQEYSFSGSSQFNAELEAGEKVRGTFSIQTPEASSPAVFTYRMSESSADYVRVDLGPTPVSRELPAELRLTKASNFGMGQAITRGDVTFAVVGWRLSQGNSQSKPAPGTKLVVADVILRNQGKAALEFAPSDRMKLWDTNLRQYRHDGRFWHVANDTRGIFTVAAGERLRFDLVFQVLIDVGDLVLVYANQYEPDVPKAYVNLTAEPVVLEIPAALSDGGSKANSIGQLISRGDLSLAVLGWELSTGTKEHTPAAGSRYVLVDVLIANRGHSTDLYSLSMTLRDAGSRQYPADWQYSASRREPSDYKLLSVGKLAAGEHVRGQVAFQVPESSSGYVFSWDATPLSGAPVSVALGPQPVSSELQGGPIPPNSNAHPVGQAIRQGDAQLAVLGWGLPQAEQSVKVPSGYQFVAVDLMLVNRGAARTEYTPAYQPYLRDADGYRYQTTWEYSLTSQRAPSPFEGGLATGKPVHGQFLYMVPQAGSGFVFIFDPQWLFGRDAGDVVVVDLGPRPVTLAPPAELLRP